MNFKIIDKNIWKRKNYFEHYYNCLPCTYSMTVKVNISTIIEKKVKLYPAMLYAITSIVNRHEEFRTAINLKGDLGIFSSMLPCYTIFHKDTETFSNLWTEYTSTFEEFYTAYEQDILRYKDNKEIMCPDIPENNFPVSMVPWASFEGFNLNLQKGYDYLLPIFTMGRYYEEQGKILLPLAIQVHHAVCDGFHLCRFINELQEYIQNNF